MTDKKQIEEIANVLYESDSKRNIVICGIEAVAEDIYNAGYRMQIEGEWIDNGEKGYGWAFTCSKCGWIDGYPFSDRHNFCPNCGAKMKGGKE